MNFLASIAVVFVLAITAFAQDRGAITGRVVDERGKGISGATVRAMTGGGAEAATATTGAKGEFRVEVAPGEYRLEFEAAGRASASLRDFVRAEPGRATKVRQKVELPVLETGSLIRGSVFGEDGRSLPGARVHIERIPLEQGSTIPEFSSRSMSDRMGLFAFKVPEGEFRYRITASRSGFANASTTVDVSGGETVNVALTLALVK
jgi:hypothetical protein